MDSNSLEETHLDLITDEQLIGGGEDTDTDDTNTGTDTDDGDDTSDDDGDDDDGSETDTDTGSETDTGSKSVNPSALNRESIVPGIMPMGLQQGNQQRKLSSTSTAASAVTSTAASTAASLLSGKTTNKTATDASTSPADKETAEKTTAEKTTAEKTESEKKKETMKKEEEKRTENKKQKAITDEVKKQKEKEKKREDLRINKGIKALSDKKTKVSNSATDLRRKKMYGEKFSKEKAEERRKNRATKESDKRRKKNIDRLEKAEKKVERKQRIADAKGRVGKFKERNRKTIERMNTLYILFQKYLMQPLIMIIVTIIIYFSVKYLMKLYKKYPRTFVLSKYLDMSGKYDKSTGLDNELAEILSNSLTDYLVTPPKILEKIMKQSIKMLNKDINEKNVDLNNDGQIRGDYFNYIKDNLFNHYINNDFYVLLRKFVEHSSDIFDKGYIIRNALDYNNNKYKNEYFEKYYDDMQQSSRMNNYLVEFFENIIKTNPTYESNIDEKLDSAVVNKFINQLKNKPDKSYVLNIEKTYENISNFFREILTTTIPSDMDEDTKKLEYYKKLFFRNVLYMIILSHGEGENSSLSMQLGKLESKNILSYIDPNIFNGNNEILKKYGNLLSMKDSNNTEKSFSELFTNSDVVLPNDITTKFSITDEFSIDDFKDKFINDLNSIKEPVFLRLNKYKDFNGKKQINYEDEYTNYKERLLNITGSKYNSENELINEIYNINNKDGDDLQNFPNKYNINKQDKPDIKILELFNYLIIFETFIANYDKILVTENDNDNYDNCVKYFYHLENLLALRILDSEKNIYIDLFDDNDKKKFISYKKDDNETFLTLLDYLLYQKDKDLINCGIFTSLIFYDQTNINKSKEDIYDLTKFYFSFVEIRLGSNFIEDVKQFKEYRTNWNIKQRIIIKKINDIFSNVIWKQFIVKQFFEKLDANDSYIYWKVLRDMISNKCTWFTTPVEKEAMNCPRNDNFVEGFGFLKGLTKLPKMFSEVPNVLKMILSFGEGIIKGFKFFNKFKPFFIGFLIFLFKIGLYMIILGVLFIISFPYFVGGIVLAIILFRGAQPIKAGMLIGLLFLTLILQQWFDSQNEKGKMKSVNILSYKNEQGKIASISIAHFLIMIVYIIIKVIILIFKIILMLIVVFALIVLYVFIIIMDEILGNYRFTKFLYKNLFACENEPLAWYKNSRYDLNNKASKGFFCSLNCKSNYRLSENSTFCEKAPSNVPYYCPQPLLYRIYKDENKKIREPYSIKSFFIKNHPGLIYNSPQKQLEFIFNYKKNKKEYYETCNSNFSKDKNIIGKNVCALGYNKNGEDINNKIKDICKQTYCSNGKYESFCYKYKGEDPLDNYKFKDKNKFIEFLKNHLALAIIVFIIIYIMNELDKNDLLKKQFNFVPNMNNFNMNNFPNMQNIINRFTKR